MRRYRVKETIVYYSNTVTHIPIISYEMLMYYVNCMGYGYEYGLGVMGIMVGIIASCD